MPARSPSPSLLAALVDHARPAGADPAAVLGSVAAALAERHGVDVDPGAGGLPDGADPPLRRIVLDAPVEALTPELLGHLHESLLDRGQRRRRGVFYTPPAIAAGVLALLAPPPDDAPPPLVCDPAVGGGAFLLAAARWLRARGHAPADIVGRALWGVDVDPVATAVAGTALALWAAIEGADRVVATGPGRHLVVGDSLLDGPGVWAATAGPPPGGFDVVVGNPPFQSQLGRATSRPTAGQAADILRRRFGSAAFRYTDSAALFLLEACRWTRPGGQVALVLPQSILAAGDAKAVRDAVLDLGGIERLWLAEADVFAASVRVCVPVVRRGGAARGPVEVRRGPGFDPAGALAVDHGALRRAPSWARLRAASTAVPAVDLAGGAGRLGSWCAATAGFRDQYYGLAPFVAEAEDAEDPRPRLVTCGLLDPARLRWGSAATRFAGKVWRAPVVDVDRLRAEGPPALAAWATDRLVPKVVVATQTRVLEGAVDEGGRWFPSVPTIAVTPGPAGPGGDAEGAAPAPPPDPWRLAAVVLAPPVSAWALARHGGAALSDDALRVSARQLLDAPLPAGEADWGAAAAHLAAATSADGEGGWRAAMHAFGAVMCAAYGVGEDVLDWWHGRLPVWR